MSFEFASPTSMEWSSAAKFSWISLSGRLVTRMWRFAVLLFVSEMSLFAQFRVFLRSVHSSRASIMMKACENLSRILRRTFWSCSSDGCWTSPQRLYRSANISVIPPCRVSDSCKMRARISLLWSCSSFWESLPSKKKYAIPSDSVASGSLSMIEELRRQVFTSPNNGPLR